MSLENDIFNNPLEAFPEFIDEPVSESVQTIVEEPEPEAPAEVPVEKEEAPKRQNKYIPSYSSANYVDPLDTVEEADLAALSDETTEYSFGDESLFEPDSDDAGLLFTKTNYTLGSIEYEDVAVKPGAELYDIDDSVPDAAPETEEVSIDDFLSDAGSGTEDVDLDAFLGDSGFADAASPSPSNTTEEVSLDDFGVDFGGVDMAAIDAFAASSKQEKSDIENAPAIEMELVFDDEFVLETKANPEDDIDFDFEALMAGESVDIPVPAATGDETLDNFDDIFDNIVDEGAPAAAAETSSDGIEFDPSAIEEVSFDEFGLGTGDSPAPSASSEEKVAEQQIVYDEVSEFDDLLSSFSDDTHVEVADNRRSQDEKAGPHDYNIIVVMEDEGEETVQQAPVVQENAEEDEDYEVSLFQNEEEIANYKNHGVIAEVQPLSGGYSSDMQTFNATDTGSFEDISLDDFGVSFEDETPSAPETPSSSEPQSEATTEEAAAEEPSVSESAGTVPVEEPAVPEQSEAMAEEDISEDIFADEPLTDEVLDFNMEDIPAEEPENFEENDFNLEETPVSEDIPDELDIAASENAVIPTECEDTAPDEKIIVELSEDCVYNGDNTEQTSNMNDGNNEEITDTMDSMNEGLLEKIVSELSVLRNEMQSLRDEVQTLKGGEAPAFEAEPAPAFQEEESVIPEEAAPSEEVVSEDIPVPEADPFAAPQEAGGFFSGDDDDETIALSGDELNNILNSADFTQEDGSNFGMEVSDETAVSDETDIDFNMEAPAEETPADDFAMDIPAEEAPAEEAVSDDFAMDIPSDDVPVDEFITETPAEEAVADDFAVEAPAEEAVADDFAMDIPSESEEPAAAPETEELSLDDFDTDLPSIKEDAEPAAEEAEAPAEDNFSLDDFDIPEPSVEENSIADIDIDEPDTEPKADDEFSLDEFDIPEPSVEENSIADIDIDEPSAEIPSDENELSQDIPSETEDTDFYANSDSPAISEDDISSIGTSESLEEPVLDDIDFNMDEPQAEDIDIPTGESLVVDSSSSDFLEEDEPTLDEQLTSDKVDYLNEEAAVDDLGSLPEIDDIPAVEGMEDSLEADTIATSEDETPADDVFSSQWDETPAEETVSDASFDAEPEEEIVHAATSFDDPVSYDIPSEEAPADDFSIDEPAADIPVEEPAFETAAAISDDALSGDIKQEVKSVLKYMDQLLENLPEDKIAEFAQSEHFETYKKLFNELGLV